MKTVECGIKAFDVHELLCHFVAQRGGFYAVAGLDVRLVDTTFTPDERLPDADYFQVACGAAYFFPDCAFQDFSCCCNQTDVLVIWICRNYCS